MRFIKQVGLVVALLLALTLPVAAQEGVGGGSRGAWPPSGLQASDGGRAIQAAESGRIKLLSETLKMAPAALLQLDAAAMKALIVKHAAVLHMDVYELTELAGKPAYQQVGFGLGHERGKPGLLRLANAPLLAPSAATVSDRIQRAIWYAEMLNQEAYDVGDPTWQYRMYKMQDGFPLWISNASRPADGTYPRMMGHYRNNATQPFGRVDWFGIGNTYDLSDVQFENGFTTNYGCPYAWADRYYDMYGNTQYQAAVQSTSGCDGENVSLWFGSTKILDNIAGQTLPYGWITTMTGGARAPGFRYALRTTASAARNTLTNGLMMSDARLAGTLPWEQGFGADIYAPLWGLTADAELEQFFEMTPYHDCDLLLSGQGTASPQPWGVHWVGTTAKTQYYAYESEACIAPSTYITNTRSDYLVPALQALHVLNLYDNPDFLYDHPNGGGTTSPTSIARWIETNGWIGHGVKIAGKDAAVASLTHTAAFLALESVLGWKYGDTTSRTYANNAADVLVAVLWGVDPNLPYQGSTIDKGVLTRTNQQNGPLRAWQNVSGAYQLAAQSYLSDAFDFEGMPREVGGLTVSDSEAALVYAQAMRIYLYYALGQKYNAAQTLIPRPSPKITAGAWNAFNLNADTTALFAQQILDSLNSFGGGATEVQAQYQATLYRCTTTNCPSTPSGGYYNFPIRQGQGLLAYTANSIANWLPPDNRMLTHPLFYELKSGANIIGFPGVTPPAVALTANELWTKVKAACGNNATIAKWLSGAWQTFTGSPEYAIERDVAYRITVSDVTQCYLRP